MLPNTFFNEFSMSAAVSLFTRPDNKETNILRCREKKCVFGEGGMWVFVGLGLCREAKEFLGVIF